MSNPTTETLVIRCVVLAPRSDPASRDLFESLAAYLRYSHSSANVELVTVNPGRNYGAFVSDATLEILRSIEGADAVIADLTGSDPNVMYEVGFAHGLKKPVLPIVQRDSSGIPSDLSGYLFYVYAPESLERLAVTVAQWLTRTFNIR